MTIRIDLPIFSGFQTAHTCCMLLQLDEELNDFITINDKISGYIEDDYIQIEMYNSVTDDTRALFHFKNDLEIKFKEFYPMLLHHIKLAFAEELI